MARLKRPDLYAREIRDRENEKAEYIARIRKALGSRREADIALAVIANPIDRPQRTTAVSIRELERYARYTVATEEGRLKTGGEVAADIYRKTPTAKFYTRGALKNWSKSRQGEWLMERFGVHPIRNFDNWNIPSWIRDYPDTDEIITDERERALLDAWNAEGSIAVKNVNRKQAEANRRAQFTEDELFDLFKTGGIIDRLEKARKK